MNSVPKGQYRILFTVSQPKLLQVKSQNKYAELEINTIGTFQQKQHQNVK